MKSYLMSAVGVIFITVIISLLVPEGKLNKSIMFLMRLICIVVLIQPIVGLFNLKTEPTVSDFFDYQYVSSVYSEHQNTQLEKLIEKEFGIETECTVSVEYVESEFKVTGAEARLKKNNEGLIGEIYSYLQELGYINITVYAQST